VGRIQRIEETMVVVAVDMQGRGFPGGHTTKKINGKKNVPGKDATERKG